MIHWACIYLLVFNLFLKKKIFAYLFIFGSAGPLLPHRPFSGCGDQGLLSRWGAWGSHGSGLSLSESRL